MMSNRSKEIWPHTGAIFCGGKSSRMGRPKAGIELPSGLTVIEHVHHVMSSVCRRVVIVGHADGVPDSLSHLEHIKDNYQDRGPIGALEALLSSGVDSEYIISPCDLFKVTPEIFSLLTDSKIKLPAVLSHHNMIEPLIGRYPAALLALVRECIDQKQLAMHSLLKKALVNSIDVPAEYMIALGNMNSPQDTL